MRGRIGQHFRANVVAYLALFLALAGGAYAASHISGRTLRKHSTPGNRLKNNSVTGKQVRESSLRIVPKATTAKLANAADTATTATTARNADNADALGGLGVIAFGPGIVNGGIDAAQNGGSFRT